MRAAIHSAKIANYARKNGNRAVSQRLGYLMETLGSGTGKAIALLRESLSNSYTPLDILANPKGRYIERWKVLVNVPENELLQWSERWMLSQYVMVTC